MQGAPTIDSQLDSGDSKQHTPMIRQYLAVKHDYPQHLVFMRMGDFYELFFDDAIEAAKLLNITLTRRGKANDGQDIPMAGVPYHAADSYFKRLLDQDRTLVVCEQSTPPEINKGRKVDKSSTKPGLMQREVSRILTPGTLAEDVYIDGAKQSTLSAAFYDGECYGVAGIDLSQCRGWFSSCNSFEQLQSVLLRHNTTEILVASDSGDRSWWSVDEKQDLNRLARTCVDRPIWVFDDKDGKQRLLQHLKHLQQLPADLQGLPAPLYGCIGALLHYLDETQLGVIPQLAWSSDQGQHHVHIDPQTWHNLEISASTTGDVKASLLGVLDTCTHAGGHRLLRQWLANPTRESQALSQRLDTIGALSNSDLEPVRSTLSQISDGERIATRIAIQRVSPRDLIALANSISIIDSELMPTLSQIKDAPLLKLDIDDWQQLAQLCRMIETNIVAEPPLRWKEGGVIRDSVNSELDQLRSNLANTGSQLATLEAQLQQQTGISTLKSGHNAIAGLYVEIPRSKVDLMPPEYRVVQTLKNSVRFSSDRISDFAKSQATDSSRSIELEQQLFDQLILDLQPFVPQLTDSFAAIAQIDVLTSLAKTAYDYGYCRPEFSDAPSIDIVQGRHPVIERLVGGNYISNNFSCTADQRTAVITGPNMGGKSTYMRQVALIVWMAHIGSYVPAKKCLLGPVDRIMTRIGASDDLSRGVSTFMQEMVEMASILRQSTAESLVVIDEVGRGTATADGISLAQACCLYLHNTKRCYQLFATHFLELTTLGEDHRGIFNLCVDATTHDDHGINFSHRIRPGAATSSFGLHVAKLAGLPTAVIADAANYLQQIEHQAELQAQQLQRPLALPEPESDSALGSPTVADKIYTQLQQIDLAELSPKQALDQIYSWRDDNE